MDDDECNLQRRMALDQIHLGGIISVGSTVFAIGATLWVLSLTVLDKIVFNQPSIINLDGLNTMATIFLSFGLAAIIIGFILPLVFLRNKTTKKNELETCNCGNKILRCPLHDH